MNGRERFRSVMRFEPTDRPPYWEVLGVEPATLERWHEEGLPADDYFEACFDLDRVEWVPLDDGLVPPFAERVEGERRGVVTRRDALGRVVRERAGNVVEVVSYPLATRADLAALRRRLDPKSPRRFPMRWADYLKAVEKRDYPLGVAVTGPMGRLVELAGPEWTRALMDEDPDFLDEALDVMTRFLIDLVRPVLAGVGEVDLVMVRERLPGPVLTREAFDRWLAPRYAALVQAAVDHRVETIALICPGDLREVVEDVRKVGFTALGPLTVAAGMDPVALRERWGPTLGLIGGIDARVLARDCEAIECAVTAAASALLPQGGWIPSVDRPVPPEVPLDNYRYYWELMRDLAEG